MTERNDTMIAVNRATGFLLVPSVQHGGEIGVEGRDHCEIQLRSVVREHAMLSPDQSGFI